MESQVDENELVLSPDQETAYNNLSVWVQTGDLMGFDLKPGQISMGGYAGTGKTTLLKHLIDKLDKIVDVMSLTGKAVSVLIKKGVPAGTIHSTIYHVEIKDKKPVFHLKTELEDPPDLFIIDEASMVNFDLHTDLLSFKIPILWVGDHGQLEPIGRNPRVMVDPDIKLERIHRQAEGNPIIMFADKVRRGAYPQAIAKKDVPEVRVVKKQSISEEDLIGVEQVIVALNRTRVKINKECRRLKGYPVDSPQPGDKVVCLKNNRYEGLFNGLQGVVRTIFKDKHWPIYRCIIELESGRVWEGEVLVDQFNKSKGLVEPERAYWKATHWDYAYAITCHKAQGSEWASVLVIEESAGPLWSMPRWRYTAVTRASERLIYGC
ncbi:MAG: ATP-dependent DNA helicase [Candidatus Thorarchaeota archaeon]|jgi:exodeoxyribonuclease-5